MNRNNGRVKKISAGLVFGLLLMLILVQIGVRIQEADHLGSYLYQVASEENGDRRQVRIAENDGTAGWIIYYVKDFVESKQRSELGDEGHFFEECVVIDALMTALILQLIISFLKPRRRYIRELEETAGRCWNCLLVIWFQHLWDGEKEIRYNF